MILNDQPTNEITIDKYFVLTKMEFQFMRVYVHTGFIVKISKHILKRLYVYIYTYINALKYVY